MRFVLILFCLAWQACGQEDFLFFDPSYHDRSRALSDVPEIVEAIDKAPLEFVDGKVIDLNGRYSLRAPGPNQMLRLRLKILKRLVFDIPGKPGLRISMTSKLRELVAREAMWPGPTLGNVIASDGNHWIRLSGGILDIRFQDETLILAQGDIVLLRAPLSEMPPQLFCDAESYLYSAHLLACQPLDIPSIAPLLRAPDDPPGNWTLSDRYEQGALEQGPDGIMLTRGATKHSVSASAEIASEAGCVLTISVRAGSVGAVVYVRGPQNGKVYRFGVGDYQGERVLCENPANADHVRSCHERGWIIGDRFWARVIIGANQSVAHFSNDGVHWVELGYDRFRGDDKFAETLAIELGFGDKMAGEIRIDPPQVQRWNGALEALALEVGISMDDLRHESVVRRADRLLAACIEAAKRGVDIDRVLPALHELPWLITPWADGQVNGDGSWWSLWEVYERLAERLAATGQGDRLVDLQNSWPSRNPSMQRYVRGIRREPWVLSELRFYQLWHRQEWTTLAEEAWRLPFSQLAGTESPASHRKTWDRRLAWWMGQEAAARLENRQSRHPLQIGRDREFDNTLGDLLSALETQEYARAARLLTQSELPEMLVPSSDDPARFIRTSGRIADIIDRSPQLQNELESHAAVGHLRFQHAQQSGDTTQLRHLRTHFYGSTVGETAALALANRALSLGQFADAGRAYRALARPPADKLALLESLQPALSSPPLPVSAPAPFDLEVVPGLKFHREAIEHYHTELVGLGGFANSATRLLVNHHCLLFCLDADRKMLWQRPRKKLPPKLPRPADPVLVDGLVIVPEHVPDSGWTLIACDEASGNLRWQETLYGDVLAGPMLLNDRLHMAIAHAERGRLHVSLQTFDPRDGALLNKRSIAGFHADPRLHLETALSTWQGEVILQTGNTLFAVDAEGPRWLYKFAAIPVDHLRAPDLQHSQPPLVIGDSIIIHALGSGGVHCVDAATGRLRWEYVEPAARNLLQLSDNRLAVFTERSFAVIRADTSAPVSYRREQIPLHSILPAANGDIAMVWVNSVKNEWDASQRRIRWFDPETAEQRAEHLLGGPKQLNDFRGLWSDGRDLFGFVVHRAWEKKERLEFVRLKARP